MRKKADTNLPDQIIKDLYKEHFALGETRVNAWEAWLVIVLAVGMFFGTANYVNGLPEYVLQCEFSSGECGGLWTSTVVHGQVGNVFGLFNETWAISTDQLANAIGVMPGFSLFMLGFVSSALIFGLIWDKFSIVNKKRGRRVKIARSRGFISSEFIGMFFLTVLMVMIVSTPVTSAKPVNSFSLSQNNISLASISMNFFAVEDKMIQSQRDARATTSEIKTQVEKNIANKRFIAGERVVVLAKTLNVRSEPDGKILKRAEMGAPGTISGGPVLRGRIWWKVTFDDGKEGWVAEMFLRKAESTGNNLFPVTQNSSEGSLLKSREREQRWTSEKAGILKLKVRDAANISAIRKNGVEIWDRGNQTKPDLKMEFLIDTKDTLDFDLAEGTAFEPEIEVNSIPETQI